MNDWRVAGRTVHVTGSTRIEQTDGQMAVELRSKSKARTDNSFDAAEIELKQGASGGGSGSDDRAQLTFKGTI